jgi:RNA polymerase sigma-54 factor
MSSTSHNLSQQQTTNIKQMQRLMMLPQMQQAVQLLQMPALELAAYVTTILEQNPILSDKEADDDEMDELEEEMETDDQEEPFDEKALSFKDDDFAILQKLDEEFRYSEEEFKPAQKSKDQEQYETYTEQSIPSTKTLFEHLMQQVHETFDSPEEIAMSETLIGNFNAEGFLNTPLEEIATLSGYKKEDLEKTLKYIQTFEPRGVGAHSLQESLLIQLSCLGKQNTLAAAIIEKNFDDLLHNRIPIIQKGLNCSSEDIKKAISNDISHLDLHPGTSFSREAVQQIVPDVTLQEDGNGFRVIVNDDYMPSIRLNSKYLKMLEDPNITQDTKDFIHKKIISTKWLLKNIHTRNETLEKIVKSLIQRQEDFFTNMEGKLIPLNMKTIAEELDVHESTIARAVVNKYLDCPRGLLPLRSFFTHAYVTNEGLDISSKTVRDALMKLIQKENKNSPLSDEDLSAQLKDQGMNCARRTVAKYRNELNLGNAHQRKVYK